MDYKNIYDAIERKSDKINYLKGLLSSVDSPAGDWKVTKIYEARMQGQEDPYNVDELLANRQLIRDEINRLQGLPEDNEA